jgi:pimeloyl-ACP methyl ester carboxylesterase
VQVFINEKYSTLIVPTIDFFLSLSILTLTPSDTNTSAAMTLIPVTAFPRNLWHSFYLIGQIPTSTLQADPRILYAAFIPDEHYPQSLNDQTKLPLLVAIHGTGRRHTRSIDAWREFALEHRCAVVAPLFPCLLSGPADLDGYHYLGRPPARDFSALDAMLNSKVEVPEVYAKAGNSDVRYDLLLLSLLDEVAIRWPAIDTSKVFLAGFSGGGQFAHRFMYLHPERLLAASLGAPGSATPLDFEKAWPAGLKDIKEIFGKNVDVEALRQLPIIASVGAEDKASTGSSLRDLLEGSGLESEKGGTETRVQNLTGLVEQWRNQLLKVEFEIVPGVKHDMEKVNTAVLPFMARQLQKYWKEKSRTHF